MARRQRSINYPVVFPLQWLDSTGAVRVDEDYNPAAVEWRRRVYDSAGNVGGTFSMSAEDAALGQSAWFIVDSQNPSNGNRAGRIGGRAFASGQLPVTGVVITALPTINTVNIGGGSVDRGQGATRVSIWTAPTVNVPTGTEQIRCDGDGHLLSWNPGRNLGASFARWGEVFAQVGNFTGGIAAGGATRVGTNGFAALGTWALFSDLETNNTTKAARLGVRAYVTAQLPVTLVIASALQTINTVNFGGGSGAGQAANRVSFWTASTVNTATGTEQIRIDGSGHVLSQNPGRNLGAAGAAFGGLFLHPFTDATRPSPGNAGRVIYNADDGNLNIDNGTNWILPDGTVT